MRPWCRGRGALRAALVVAATALAAAAEPAALAGRALGTTWAAKWIQPATPIAPSAVERQLVARLEQFEQHFSTYRPDSDLSRFNATAHTEWIPVPQGVAQAAARAREISARTAGAFDVTVGPLLRLWGFGPFRARDSWPTPAEVAATRAVVGWRQLEARLDPPALRRTQPGVTVDFSSLAKGLAVDALSDCLRELGAPNHLVQIGGDMKAAGLGAAGHGWRVAIEQPAENSRSVAHVVQLVDRALSTSGNYRNFVTLDERRAGHLIDPRSGQPASGPLAAVSVLDSSCAASSALATGLFVLGPDDGWALATRENLAVLFLVTEGGSIAERATLPFASLARATMP